MQTRYASMIAAGALAFALAACGDDSSDETETGAGATTTEAAADDTEAPAAGGGTVETASTDLGEVLVDGEGFTLYGFTPDTDGVPTCNDDCATSWPPFTVESEELPEGLDAGLFSVVERDDGRFQLVAGDWPLYRFAGDGGPGDVNGQGVGDQWFAISPEGELVQDAGAGEDDGGSDENHENHEEGDDSGGGYDY